MVIEYCPGRVQSTLGFASGRLEAKTAPRFMILKIKLILAIYYSIFGTTVFILL